MTIYLQIINKRPKWPHIVHLSTMCHLFNGSARATVFVDWSKHKLGRGRWDIAKYDKFRWIPFSGFRKEVENVSVNQWPGRPSCFSDRPEKHKLGRGHSDLASCQFSLNSVLRFQRRSRKCLSKSQARAAILFFLRSAPKNTNFVEDIEILLPNKFRWNLFSGFRGEFENGSANQRPGRPSCFSNRPEKHKLGRRHWDLASSQVSLNSVLWFQRTSGKCLSQSEARAAILFFPIGPKNTNL